MIKWLWSYILGVKISSYKSPLNGNLEVWLINGKKVLNSQNANYAFDSLHHIFQKTFHKTKLQNKDIEHSLILGFGVGSIASILQSELKIDCKITGVEYDPIINKIGKEMFTTHTLKNTTILEQDALAFAQTTYSKYQLIVIDIFNDLNVPDAILCEAFFCDIHKLLDNNGVLFFNCISHDHHSTNKLLRLIHFLEKNKFEIEIFDYYKSNYILYIKKNNSFKYEEKTQLSHSTNSI